MDEDVIFMADETLLTLAADIVSAHVSHNAVAADQLPVLIQSVYASLAGLGQAPAPVRRSASLPFRCARRSRPMPSPASNAARR
jgi:predicted transcriptional regulator